MNFSHGSHEYHLETINNVRKAAANVGMPIGIALDTKGPEIRTGVMKAGVNAEVELVAGNEIIVTINDQYKEICDEHYLWVDYKNIIKVRGYTVTHSINQSVKESRLLCRLTNHNETEYN